MQAFEIRNPEASTGVCLFTSKKVRLKATQRSNFLQNLSQTLSLHTQYAAS